MESKGGHRGHVRNHCSAGVCMAHIQRLTTLLALLLALCGHAWASFPATATAASASCWAVTCTYGHINNIGTEMGWYSTYEAAKAAVAAGYTGTNAINSWADPGAPAAGTHYITTYARYGTGNWLATSTVLSKPVAGSPQATTTYSCPANSTVSGSSCSCNTGYDQSGSSCVDPNVAKCDGKKGGVDLFTGGSLILTGKPYCASSGVASKCGGKVTGAWALVKDGVKTWTLEVTYDGSTCTPAPSGSSPTTTTNEAPTPCKGQPGIVNGVSVCIPFSASNSPAETVGSTTTTAPDGSTTSKVEDTSCVGSKCTTTTTTTTTPPGGGTPTTTVTTQDKPKDDFCAQNPRSPMCIESSFSGSCSAPPACTGDAVQCAVASATHKTHCALTVAPENDPSINAYNIEAAKSQGDQTAGITSTVTIGANSFDQSDALGAQGQLQDQTVSVAGQQIVIPWSASNEKLVLIGQIMQAVTFLLCLRIVFRG